MDKAYTHLSLLKDEISKCIKCGVCMAGCPTYAMTKDETRVARGRLTLAGAVLDGRITVSRRFEEAVTSCIGCLTCDLNCPSGVRIGEVMFAAKAEIAETRGLNIVERIASKFVVGCRWPLSILVRLAAIPIGIYEGIPLRGPLAPLMPFVRNSIKRKLPVPGGRPLTSQYPEIVKTKNKRTKGRVAFYPGCVIDLSTQEIGRATISVLNKLGYDVVIPKGQYCCGSPLQSLGDVETARNVAQKNVDLFSPLNVSAIIVSCATCGHTLKKEYPLLLGQSVNGSSGKVKEFSGKITDIHEFVMESVNGDLKIGKALGGTEKKRVTFHDPCHLKKGLGVYKSPREILTALPTVGFTEMEEADACCGFGGIFSLYHYDLAADIGARKAESIKRTGSEIVATGCPGCKIHIEDSLHRAGYPATVRHTVELLDEVLTYYHGDRI